MLQRKICPPLVAQRRRLCSLPSLDLTREVYGDPEGTRRFVTSSSINPSSEISLDNPRPLTSSAHPPPTSIDGSSSLERKDLEDAMDIMFRNVDSNNSNSRLYKILVLGEVHSGKSALIRRYVHNFFSDFYNSTVGVDFHVKILPYNEELEIRVQLWDIAGQERFTQMTRAYFKGAMGAFVIFDQNNAQSFQSVERWKREIDAKCFLPDGRSIPTILLCNKCDLPRDNRLLDEERISEFVVENGLVPNWIRTSALTGEGVDEAMRVMIRYIMAMDKWSPEATTLDYSGNNFDGGLKINDDKDKRRKSSRCPC